MKKNYLIIFGIILLCFLFTGCKKKSYCEKNGHDFINATCTEPEKCAECGIEGNPALGHNLVVEESVEPTCTEDGLTEGKYCTRCNYVEEQVVVEALGHNYSDATCIELSKCTNCGKTTGSLLAHEYDYGCDTTCNNCGFVRDEIAHEYNDATIDAPKTCKNCSATEGTDLLVSSISEYVPKETSKSLTLPTTILDYNVTWETSDNDILLNDGIIVANSINRNVTLIAKIDVNGQEYVREFDVLVKAVNVSSGAYDIAYNYYSSKLNKTLSKDVMLITNNYNGCSVRYISMDESIITSSGEVFQQKVAQNTIMKVYVIKNNIAIVYNTEINVSAFNAATRINLTKETVNAEVEAFRKGEIDKLSVYHDDYEVNVKWIANIPEFIMTETIQLTPLEKTNIRLKAVLSYETTSFDLSYELDHIGGLMTEAEFFEMLLKYMAEVELKGSINHLHPEYNDELFLDYQERINSYGVLNLAQGKNPNVVRDYIIDTNRTDFLNRFFSGIKPTASQDLLNQLFYEGYKNPNDSNVLYITVHESAMTVVGQNAKFLAQIQYRYAFEQKDARQASWHYQVDAYDIYQSFEDNISGWHAGETYGNRYGIGIEMCVNSDGNYEGTLANNAKLVASLMLKYNLSFDNVYRHYDHSGKECPSYLIRTNRWYEFVQMVGKEYLIQKYFKDTTIEYELSTDSYATTEEVLNKYFISGDNNLYYNKPVSEGVNVNFVIKVNKNGKEYSMTSSFMLLPESAGDSVTE